MSTFCLYQLSKTGSLDSKLIVLDDKLNLMTRFEENNSFNPNLKQKQKAKELGFSDSTSNDKEMIKNTMSLSIKRNQKKSKDLK